MVAEGIDVFYFSAIALIVVLVTARIVMRKYGSFFKSHPAVSSFKSSSAADRMFAKRRIPTIKNCPNCAAQLPLSGLICDSCDYNFLAGSVCRGNKMLPAPEAYADHGSNREIASAEI